jgi:hypothetical protein
MAGSGKKRTTMAKLTRESRLRERRPKLTRESRLRERRLDKLAKKDARKLAVQDRADENVSKPFLDEEPAGRSSSDRDPNLPARRSDDDARYPPRS